MLNKEDKSFILDRGSILSAGFEYAINEKLSFGLSHSFYNLFDEVKKSPDISSNFPGLPIISDSDTENDLEYNKIGHSII